MKYAIITALFLGLASFSWAQQVHHGETFVLNEPIQPTGNDEYSASSYISLEPGFFANPEAGTSLLFRLSHWGIQDVTSDVSAYPNPTQNVLNIDLLGRPIVRQGRIQIIDATGRVCMEQPVVGFSERLVLDVSGLEPGLYLYRINGIEHEPLKGRFIKE